MSTTTPPAPTNNEKGKFFVQDRTGKKETWSKEKEEAEYDKHMEPRRRLERAKDLIEKLVLERETSKKPHGIIFYDELEEALEKAGLVDKVENSVGVINVGHDQSKVIWTTQNQMFVIALYELMQEGRLVIAEYANIAPFVIEFPNFHEKYLRPGGPCGIQFELPYFDSKEKTIKYTAIPAKVEDKAEPFISEVDTSKLPTQHKNTSWVPSSLTTRPGNTNLGCAQRMAERRKRMIDVSAHAIELLEAHKDDEGIVFVCTCNKCSGPRLLIWHHMHEAMKCADLYKRPINPNIIYNCPHCLAQLAAADDITVLFSIIPKDIKNAPPGIRKQFENDTRLGKNTFDRKGLVNFVSTTEGPPVMNSAEVRRNALESGGVK
jgi:hypothetical protein